MDYIDTTHVGDTFIKKISAPWTKKKMKKALLYGQHSDILFDLADKTKLSKGAADLIHHLILRHPYARAITYKEFYAIGFLKDKPFPFGPGLRRELEEKGFILSHCDVGKVGEVGQSVGDICEFIFITENFPCE